MISVLHNFKVDGEWVVAIEVRNEYTGKDAGSSMTPASARALARALALQADAADAGREVTA